MINLLIILLVSAKEERFLASRTHRAAAIKISEITVVIPNGTTEVN